ncbi:MAG: homocysteine S-methyltransferase family protein [Pseudomonadota bacterium]
MTITILDGGVGQELVKRGSAAPTPLWSTRVMLEEPELVRAVHDEFFAAGADIVTANSYSAHHDRLAAAGLDDQFEALHRAACGLAGAARDAHGQGLIAGSLGPIGWSYRPEAAPPPEGAAPLYREIAALQAPLVDVLLCETMSSVAQARGALMGVSGAGKPVWLAISTADDDGGRLRSGEPATEILPLLDAFEIDALLVNCTRPEAVTDTLALLQHCGAPLGAYANGFSRIAAAYRSSTATVEELSARDDMTPERYADHAERWAELGATIIGGCCEIGPAHIAAVKSRLC